MLEFFTIVGIVTVILAILFGILYATVAFKVYGFKHGIRYGILNWWWHQWRLTKLADDSLFIPKDVYEQYLQARVSDSWDLPESAPYNVKEFRIGPYNHCISLGFYGFVNRKLVRVKKVR